MRIRKGDTVKIIRGKDKGRKGKVVKVIPKENKLVVEGLNLVTKHVRPRREGEKGQRIKMAMPLDVSMVMFVCPRCGQTIKVGYKLLTDGRKVRFCRKCKDVF